MKHSFLISACLLLCYGADAQTNNYYVSTTGSDSNNGTQALPWATIAHAASALTLGSAGAVVHVAPGTYGAASIGRSGTSTARITFISDTKWAAKLPSITANVNYVDIDNFEVNGTGCTGISLGGSYERAIGNNVHNTAAGCDNSNGGAGINFSGYISNVPTGNQAIGNFVHDVGAVNASCQNHTNGTIQGIYEHGSNGLIENNIVIAACQCAIVMWHGATAATIVNNTTLGGLVGIDIGTGDFPCSIQTCVNDYTSVINNIVVGAVHIGIDVGAQSPAIIGTHNQYLNNLLYNNAVDLNLTDGKTCVNCILGQDPLFVNNTGTSSGDYHLQSGSPAIGAATTTDAPSTDFDGNTRTAPITIGAYQFGAVSPPSSLVAYWKLDDGSGVVAADSSGNNNTMTLVNWPTWQTASNCVVNGCLAFNGTNQSGSASLNLSSTNVITIAFWMKWNAFQNDDKLAFEFSSNFNNSTTGFMVDPDESSSGKFWVSVHGNAGYNSAAFARPSAGVWHHYAFVLNNGAAMAAQVTPYVDGVAVPYTKSPYSIQNTNNFGNDRLYVMSRDGSTLFGAGSLDEVYVYSTALSASEISALAVATP